MTQLTLYVSVLFVIIISIYSVSRLFLLPDTFGLTKTGTENKISVLTETKRKVFYEDLKLLALIADMELYLSENKISGLKKGRVNSVSVVLNIEHENRELNLEHLKRIEELNKVKLMAQVNILNSVKKLKTT